MKKIKRLVYLKLARRLSRGSAGAPVPSIISENTKVQGDIISDGIVHILSLIHISKMITTKFAVFPHPASEFREF